jgi:hypothetical protein
MAISWLSLARQYEAIERLFQGTGEAALTGEKASCDPSVDLIVERGGVRPVAPAWRLLDSCELEAPAWRL